MLALLFLSGWGSAYVDWDRQFVGPRVGSCVATMGVLAAIAAAVSVGAVIRHVRTLAWRQVLVLSLTLMAGTLLRA
ncbi:hypothetical protein OHA28_00570 [Streptomyces sp. NBC_00269]|uniref:hypothetical protein n=1 Tax=Streptomyces sp. NBC_00269 TaxID=2975696 RepID=UPI002E282C7A|nr:hypothetical protein [Streptomyces sp. NBC_00269]